MMNTSISFWNLLEYLNSLVALHFPDSKDLKIAKIDLAEALERCEYSFARIKRKYYQQDGKPVFNHLNADYMATLLYFLGNGIWKRRQTTDIPVRLSYLNKILHSLDLYYSVEMPRVFMLVHPLGSVIGKARYGDYLVIYQQCTIGADENRYPILGEGVLLYSRTSLIGDCIVGEDVVFGANSFVINTNIPSKSVVLGMHPNIRIKESTLTVRARCFDQQ